MEIAECAQITPRGRNLSAREAGLPLRKLFRARRGGRPEIYAFAEKHSKKEQGQARVKRT